MAMASKQLLAFVFATPFFLVLVPNNVHSQTDTTSFKYDGFDPEWKDLTFERDAFVPPASTFLRLTKTNALEYPQPDSVGRVLYSPPIKFSDQGRQASFETTIRFAISPVNNNPADGMTFFIVPVNSTTPTGGKGGSLGIFNAVRDESPIFAVEFDTYINSGDPIFRHIGIDINSKYSVKVTSFEDALGQVVTARINYKATSRRISVEAVYGLNRSSVSYEFNLKSLLPELVQVGISASTGPSLVQANDVYSWYFTSTLVWDGDNGEENYMKQYVM